VAPAAWQRRVDVLAGHFGLRRAVVLRVVDDLDAPVTAGWWRPVVLLPAALLLHMPTDLVEALLAHELAHIRRHDYLVNLLQKAVEAMLFYHPVTWWLSRRIRLEREQVADRLAAEVACSPRGLARALAELSEIQHAGPSLHFAQAAHGGHLMSRIEHLVGPARRAHPAGRIVFPLLGLLAAGLCTFTYAQIGQDRDEESLIQLNPSDDPTDHDTYALVRKERDGENILSNITIGGPHDNLQALEALKRRVPGDFLWVRRDGHDYVVTDPALLARARDAWRDTEAMGAKMEALGAQMEVHGRKMEAIGERMSALSEDQEPSPQARAAEREIAKLEREQEAIEHEADALSEKADETNDEATREQLARKLEALSAKLEALSTLQQRQSELLEADARRMEARQAPMEALSREMDAASAPMDALGKQMDALSAQHEKLSAQARIEMRRLIDEAMARKLAAPAR
jgi:DNA repair exonuclease SbcCD ATPase subunit